MPVTPDRRPGPLREDEEVILEANATGPSVAGAFNYDGTSFKMRDSVGTFNPRAAGTGISEATHETLDSLVHALAETSYTEVTRSGNLVTAVTTWTDNTKTTKVREALVTRSGNLVSEIVEKQYNAAGTLIQTLTHTITRSGNMVASVDTVET